MTDSPEIKRLRSHTLSGMAPADVAIQAVRDTEARYRQWIDTVGRGCPSNATIDAFLSPDNPEGKA